MIRKLLTCCAVLFSAGVVLRAADHGTPLSYSSGLMEYYAVYRSTIDAKAVEEAYIVYAPDAFAAHEKDEAKQNEDRLSIRDKLQKAVARINEGTHTYTIFLHAELGDYDAVKEEFKCALGNRYSCIDIDPLKKGVDAESEDGKDQTVIMRGLLFNKVNKIKMFFTNSDEFTALKCPARKAKEFLKNRTGPSGDIHRDVYVLMNIEILPGSRPESKRQLDDITKNIAPQSIESSYFMMAKIQSIEVYNDTNFQESMGRIQQSETEWNRVRQKRQSKADNNTPAINLTSQADRTSLQ
jgi:hypothetical protein